MKLSISFQILDFRLESFKRNAKITAIVNLWAGLSGSTGRLDTTAHFSNLKIYNPDLYFASFSYID